MSDLISRDAAIKAICEHGTDLERRGIMVLSVSNHKQATVDLLESLPSAENNEWCDNCKEYDHSKHCCPRFNRVIRETVEEVKQNAEQKWIPVSEAMPEEADGTVLVCMPNKFPYNEKEPFVNAKHNRQVETATYSQYSDTWHYTDGGVKSTRPIAWMPLPMPWRGEEDEERLDATEQG